MAVGAGADSACGSENVLLVLLRRALDADGDPAGPAAPWMRIHIPLRREFAGYTVTNRG